MDLAQQMYVAYYGRPGDPDGLTFWAGKFDQSNDLDAALAAFGNSEEFNEGFGLLDNEQLVNGLYRQIFSRDSDPAGLGFFVDRLENGQASLASIAKQIADGALNEDLVTLGNKVWVANEFTSHIKLNSLAYISTDIPVVQDLLAAVTALPESVTLALRLVTAYPDTAPRYPFPQHAIYALDTIKPDHVDQADMDRAVTKLYDSWKRARLQDDCGEDRFYVSVSEAGGSTSGSISISEGHGYGMMITVLMAGYDPQSQAIFDGLYRFFKDHPSVISPDLMAWKQVQGCGDVEPGSTSSATDGDMDIAYALLLAHRQWGSFGAINYRQEALRVIEAIMTHEVNTDTFTMTLGDWVTPDVPEYYYSTRSSDFMPGHLRAFGRESGDETWRDVLVSTYSLFQNLQTEYSPVTGLLPDFVQGLDTTPRPADPGFLEGDADGWYYYNACRDPWRIGVDVLLYGDYTGLDVLSRMNTWVRDVSSGDPALIYAGYMLDGSSSADKVYVDIAFIAPFGVSAMIGAVNQQWLNDLWDFTVNHPIEEEDYYDSTLKLLALLVISGNWWEP